MRSKKKILPLLIAATLTIGVTAVAATGKISMWTGSSASRADYTSLPTSEQITKDVGYRPVLIVPFTVAIMSPGEISFELNFCCSNDTTSPFF